MPETLLTQVRSLRAALASVDPSVMTGADCAVLVGEVGLLAKACDAAVARAAARAADCGEHRRAGFADAGTWLAQTNGSGVADAITALDAVRLAPTVPSTSQLLASGELSLSQAAEIARTEHNAPGSEAAMIETARTTGLKALRDEGRRRRHQAADRDDLHRRQRRARRVNHWTDDLGMTCVNITAPPHLGVRFINRLEAETDRVWRSERRRLTDRLDQMEPRAAYMADAFFNLLGVGQPDTADTGETGAAPGDQSAAPNAGQRASRTGRTELVLVWDLMAYIRGHIEPGEVGHILGGGPIPDPIMRQLSQDAFYKIVTHDGINIQTISHHGRHLPAQLRTALTLGPPPTFKGNPCRCGCGRTLGLEIDHITPLAAGGQTEPANLEPLCKPSHALKTEQDRAAGLLNPRNREGPAPP